MARQRPTEDAPQADRPEGVVTEQPPEAAPKKKPYAPDPELRAMSRIARILDDLPPEGRQRVGVWIASKYERKVQ